MPLFLGDHPEAKEQVGDGMGGDGVAQSVGTQNHSLINHTAKDASQPMLMSEPENQRGSKKRANIEQVVWREQPVRRQDVTLKKRAIKYLLEQRYDQRRSDDACAGEQPKHHQVFAEMLLQIPRVIRFQ